MKTSTFFGQLAEFGTAEIPLADCCLKYFGLDIAEAKRNASLNKLAVPAYRGGSQKSQWLISAQDLAERIDQLREEARKDWVKNQPGAPAPRPAQMAR